MIINTRFSIGEHVLIIEIDQKAVVRCVKVMPGNVYLYYVSFWVNAKLEEEWLDEDELRKEQ